MVDNKGVTKKFESIKVRLSELLKAADSLSFSLNSYNAITTFCLFYSCVYPFFNFGRKLYNNENEKNVPRSST